MPIFLLSNGWHASLALPHRAIPRGTLAAAEDFPRGDYLLFGWGEHDFYTHGGGNAWTIAKALLLPNRSAVHVVPVRGAITRRFPRSEIIELKVTRPQLAALCRALNREFARRDGQLVRRGRGYVKESRFYLGANPYFMPKTCNVWTARMLETAGFPLSPGRALLADDLMWQMRKQGRLIGVLRRPGDPY